jgi:hypothetical protein
MAFNIMEKNNVPKHTETEFSKSMRCRRIVLSPELAVEIYAEKVKLQRPRSFGSCINVSRLSRGQSAIVAEKYNVSAKTIRDIWNRKTWTFATCRSCRQWENDHSLAASSFPDQVIYIQDSDLRSNADIFHCLTVSG